MNKLKTFLFLTSMSAILTACGAPQPPLPFGYPVPINDTTNVSDDVENAREPNTPIVKESIKE